MDPRLVDLSRTIDPKVLGRRIRAARIAAGMTQAEVVAGEASVSYLSRIEDGQRRADPDLLERMAQRMRTTVEALLVDQAVKLELAVDHAELALLSGDGDSALEQADAVLPQLNAPEEAVLRRRARRVRAGALEALGDLQGAIVELEELAADPTPDAAWLRSLIALSRCYRDVGDIHNAIAVGMRAEGIIEELGLAGLTEAIQLTVTVAGAYHRLGDLGEAMRTCVRAIEAAERYDSPIGTASAYWNASIVETAAGGATPVALDLAKKALALFEVGDDARNLANLRATVAAMQLAADPPDPEAAMVALDRAESELASSGGSACDRAAVHVIRARAHLLLGDTAAAAAEVRRGRDLAPGTAPFLHARACSLQGQIAASEGRIEEAKRLYREAVTLLSSCGSDRHAAVVWYELAQLLTDVGDTEAALAAFQSATDLGGFKVGLRTHGHASG